MMNDDAGKGHDISSKAGQGASWLERTEKSPYSREELTVLEEDRLDDGLLGLINDRSPSLKKGKVMVFSRKATGTGIGGSGPDDGQGGPKVDAPERTRDRAMEGLVRDVLRGGLPLDGKLVRSVQDDEGARRWFMVSCMPIESTNGASSEILLLSMDVSDLREELERAIKDLNERDFTISNLGRELEAVVSRTQMYKELSDMISRVTGSGSFVVDTGSMKVLSTIGMGPLLGPVYLGRGDLGSILEFVSEEDRDHVRSFILSPRTTARSAEMTLPFRSRDGRRMLLTSKLMEQGREPVRTVALCVLREDGSGPGYDAERPLPASPKVANERSLLDRELRIVELKSEVNELLLEMGRPVRYMNDRV